MVTYRQWFGRVLLAVWGSRIVMGVLEQSIPHMRFICDAIDVVIGAAGSLLMGWILWRQRFVTMKLCQEGVRIVRTQEWKNAWSTHIKGTTANFRRMCWAKIRTWCGWVPDPYPRGARLFMERVDCDVLERCSQEAWGMLLDSLADAPKAIVVSASVLNYEDRNPRRLRARIEALARREQWQMRRIVRRHSVVESLVGGALWGWQIRDGDRYWAIHAPGIIAWKVGQPVPRLPGAYSFVDFDADSPN